MTSHTASTRVMMWPLPFWVGLAVLAIVWLGPLPERAQTAFSPNMIIHLAVVAVAAPLLAWGLAGLDGAPVTRHAVRWILLAALFDMAVVLGWHVPLLHEAAARSWVLFSVEQITFLIAGLGMWYLAFRDLSSVDAIVVAAAFFLTFMHMSVLGIVLVLAPHLLYDPSVCRGSFGLSALEDQRLGGILMASWGSFTYLAGAMWLLWRTLGRRADAARDGRSGQTL